MKPEFPEPRGRAIGARSPPAGVKKPPQPASRRLLGKPASAFVSRSVKSCRAVKRRARISGKSCRATPCVRGFAGGSPRPAAVPGAVGPLGSLARAGPFSPDRTRELMMAFESGGLVVFGQLSWRKRSTGHPDFEKKSCGYVFVVVTAGAYASGLSTPTNGRLRYFSA